MSKLSAPSTEKGTDKISGEALPNATAESAAKDNAAKTPSAIDKGLSGL